MKFFMQSPNKKMIKVGDEVRTATWYYIKDTMSDLVGSLLSSVLKLSLSTVACICLAYSGYFFFISLWTSKSDSDIFLELEKILVDSIYFIRPKNSSFIIEKFIEDMNSFEIDVYFYDKLLEEYIVRFSPEYYLLPNVPFTLNEIVDPLTEDVEFM